MTICSPQQEAKEHLGPVRFVVVQAASNLSVVLCLLPTLLRPNTLSRADCFRLNLSTSSHVVFPVLHVPCACLVHFPRPFSSRAYRVDYCEEGPPTPIINFLFCHQCDPRAGRSCSCSRGRVHQGVSSIRPTNAADGHDITAVPWRVR